MLQHANFTDEDKAAITEKLRELATFESGDRVTVEPPENDGRFRGSEYAGMPLIIDDVTWNSNNLSRAHRAEKVTCKPDDHDQRFVEVEGDGEYAPDAVYVSSVSYDFEQPTGDHYIHHHSETGLIPWEEYRAEHDKVHLRPQEDGRYEYVVPDEDEPCPICGCEMHNFSGHDQKVVHVGTETCAACGYQFGWWD